MGSEGGEAVVLNVYDMYWTNGWTSSLGIGVYHTGVEVYGREFAYGGHQYDFTGIFEIRPRCEDELGDHYKFKESVVLGMTTFRESEVDAAVCHLGSEFRGRAYNLLNKNCNNFAATFGLVLCGKELPGWVNRLAYLAACVPFVEKMVPAEWLSPLAMQQEVSKRD